MILRITGRPTSINAQQAARLATTKKLQVLYALLVIILVKPVTPQPLTVPVAGAQLVSPTSYTQMLFVMRPALKGSMVKLSVHQPTSAALVISNARYAPARLLMNVHLAVLKELLPTSSNMGPPVVLQPLARMANTLMPPRICVVCATQAVRHVAETL